MKPNEIETGMMYEGPRRRGHRVTRHVEAIEPHPGFATEVRFVETYLSVPAHSRTITLKSFASWAVVQAAI